MNVRHSLACASGCVLFLACASGYQGHTKDRSPVNRYGLVLKYRKTGEDSFRASHSHAVECFQDAAGTGVYISQTGALAVVPSALFKPGEGKEKAPLPQHGFELRVRKAGGETAKFGIECYSDENSGGLIYLSETGALAVVPARYAKRTQGKPKEAPLTHGLKVKVRGSGEAAKTYGIDVFEDHNNDNLLYLSETGWIAVVPRALVSKETTSGKKPQWQYGFRVKVGTGGKSYGIEVYRDADNGCLVYIADNGTIAVVPSELVRLPDGKAVPPVSRRGLSLATRTVTEKDFTRSTRKFAVVVLADSNTGQLVYLSDTGALAVRRESEPRP
jgi:hypothetical protein